MKTEDINNHQVFQVIQNIINRLSQDDANKVQIEHRETILDALSYIESRIKNSIHSLVFPETLTQIQNSLQSSLNELNNLFANTELNNFWGNKRPEHLTSLLSKLKNALHFTAELPTHITGEENLFQFINNFKTIIQTEEEDIKKRLEKFDNTLKSLSDNLSITDTNLSNVQKQVNQLITNLQNDYNYIKQNIIQESNNQKNQLTQKTDELLKELNTKLEDAKKIVNIIGNFGITGGYQKYAEYHRKQANTWRWISIVFMTISLIYLGYTVNNISHYEWHISLLRILSTALFIYPAQYAANQSSKHREQEIFNKKMELDLAAINPFIELFDEKKKQEIKEKLVEKYFNNNLTNNKSETDIPITIYEKITNHIINLIKSLK